MKLKIVVITKNKNSRTKRFLKRFMYHSIACILTIMLFNLLRMLVRSCSLLRTMTEKKEDNAEVKHEVTLNNV